MQYSTIYSTVSAPVGSGGGEVVEQHQHLASAALRIDTFDLCLHHLLRTLQTSVSTLYSEK